MKKFYPTLAGKVCLTLIISCFFTRFAHAQIRTYDTTFDGWNAIVTEDLGLTGHDSAAGIIFFPGIGQQDKNINDLTVNGPHYLIRNGMWDGSVKLGNGVHHPYIISLQPPASGYPATVVKPKIDEILARYRIKRNSLFFTGLSMGAWQANEFLTYEATPGDHTYGRMVKAMVNLEGVEPSDYTGIYSSLPYPGKMGDWAKNCGGRELWVEGSQDWRDMLAGAQNMNAAVSGSATYFKVTYGGGAHCCWNTEYEPGVTWTKASNPDISQLVGTALPMNVWQWLLRQGDTSMPANAPAPPPSSKPATAPATPPPATPPPATPPPATPPPASPTVSAGADPTITLPVTTTTLKAAAAGPDGAKITKVVWQQSQGPVSAKIVSPSDLSTEITGLTKAGTYVFRITVTDNNGKQAASVVDVVAKAAAAPKTETPPTMSAGKGQKITLPTSATMLEGTAAGTDGAKIVTISWAQVGGPEKAKIASPASLKTEVSGLTEAGAYIFQLIVIDNNGKSADGSMTVTVEPDDTKAPPTVSAGPNLTVTLPTNSATLKGSATGHNGAVVNSYFWMFVTGPAWVKFSDEWALTTTVSGLVAGTYVFELSASDNKDETSTSMMTLVVKPKSGTAPATTGPTQETGNAALLPDPALVDPNAHGLVIYPNPVQGMLNLRLADSTTGRMVIKIFDANGRFIQGSVLEKGGISVESAIDVSKLSKGIYVMQLMSESGGMMTRKFVKL